MRLLLSIIVSLMATSAIAGEFFLLEMGDAVLKGNQGDTIRIKRELRNQHPGENFRKAKLMSVMMVAKSRRGRGSAQLVVGQSTTTSQAVSGGAQIWAGSDQDSFDRVLFKGPANQNGGRWQMTFTGRHKVHQLMVEVDMDSTRNVVLDYAGLHLKTNQGGQDTLFLKRKAQQMGYDLSGYELVSATLVAKSRRGRGNATLRVGQSLSFTEVIDGAPAAFNSVGGYSSIEMENPSANSRGAWQIQLNGNIKIKEVVLKLQEI